MNPIVITKESLPILFRSQLMSDFDNQDLMIIIKSKNHIFGIMDPNYDIIKPWDKMSSHFYNGSGAYDNIRIDSLSDIDEAHIVMFDYERFISNTAPKYGSNNTRVELITNTGTVVFSLPETPVSDYCWLVASLKVNDDGDYTLLEERKYIDMIDIIKEDLL